MIERIIFSKSGEMGKEYHLKIKDSKGFPVGSLKTLILSSRAMVRTEGLNDLYNKVESVHFAFKPDLFDLISVVSYLPALKYVFVTPSVYNMFGKKNISYLTSEGVNVQCLNIRGFRSDKIQFLYVEVFDVETFTE